MSDQEKQQAWMRERKRLLAENKEYQQTLEGYKMKSGADWLLFAIPVVAGIVSYNYIPIANELLRWLATVGVTIVVFAICVFIKSTTIPGRTLEEIEKDVKEQYLQQLE
ncbi:MAG: hypothetical protein IKS64_03915 [Muribaculaceae bacterium]|nr:hypothetical protein [Prevotella sp.]MBR6431978.1 hypothetical protein [Muribaculaceae bacterium]